MTLFINSATVLLTHEPCNHESQQLIKFITLQTKQHGLSIHLIYFGLE